MEPRSALESSPKLKEFFKKQPAIVVIFVHAETMRHRDPERLRIIIALVLVDTPILASLSLAEAHLTPLGGRRTELEVAMPPASYDIHATRYMDC